jgi:glutaredoxin
VKNLLLVFLIGAGAYYFWADTGSGGEAVQPLKENAYVVVYGRDSCGYTQKMREQLSRAGIRHQYKIIDKSAVAERIHDRMRKAGIDTSRYPLPVVDVNGSIRTRPDAEWVVQQYKSGF